jgi:hypothetical protein
METYREGTEERVSGGQRDRGQVFVSAVIVISADVGRPAGGESEMAHFHPTVSFSGQPRSPRFGPSVLRHCFSFHHGRADGGYRNDQW